MSTYKHRICYLVEIRTDEGRVRCFCKHFDKTWEWAALPSRGMSGGIIVLWHCYLCTITPISFNCYTLHLVVSAQRPAEWVLIVVYNSVNTAIQNMVWKSLHCISQFDMPWLITGDFNTILNPDEHMDGPFSYYSSKARAFHDFISLNSLLDMGFVGPNYTWCNGQQGLGRRWARLDCF